MSSNEDDFRLASLGIEIHCPACGNEMVGDGKSLRLAASPTGAILECGACFMITQWKFVGTPLRAERVLPLTWGGSV